MAVSNTVANLSGFLAPLSTGHLLDVENSLQQWQLAFWVHNSILFLYLKLNLYITHFGFLVDFSIRVRTGLFIICLLWNR